MGLQISWRSTKPTAAPPWTPPSRTRFTTRELENFELGQLLHTLGPKLHLPLQRLLHFGRVCSAVGLEAETCRLTCRWGRTATTTNCRRPTDKSWGSLPTEGRSSNTVKPERKTWRWCCNEMVRASAYLGCNTPAFTRAWNTATSQSSSEDCWTSLCNLTQHGHTSRLFTQVPKPRILSESQGISDQEVAGSKTNRLPLAADTQKIAETLVAVVK